MVSIVARAGDVSASVKPNRPSWRDMNGNYKGEETASSDFYPLISRRLVKLVEENPGDWANTCAVRMSYALNRSGIRLPKAYSAGGTVVGEDGFNYWIRVKDLKQYLRDRFKGGDFEHVPKPIKALTQDAVDERVQDAYDGMINKISGKTGIIVFDVTGWRDASGYFTLWDGNSLVYVGPGDRNNPRSLEYYFWLYREVSGRPPAQTVKTTFWELK